MKIGENIKKYRVYRNMTQEDLAKQLSRSKSVVSHWEKGENNPDLDTCELICKVLRITPNVLFGWEVFEEYERYYRRMTAYAEKIAELKNQKADIDNQIAELNRELKDVDS